MCYVCEAYTAVSSGLDSELTGLQASAAQLLKPSLERMLLASGDIQTNESSARSQQASLEQITTMAVQGVEDLLAKFVTAEFEYLEKMRFVYGESLSVEEALKLLRAWQSGDFSVIPTISFLTAAELNGANGAYDSQAQTIYLSKEFVELYQNHIPTLVSLLAEELGHHIDTILNGGEDTVGDEGAVFSKVLQGETVSESVYQQLQSEDDQVLIRVGEQEIQAEVNQGNNQISFVETTSTAGDFIAARSYGAGAWTDFNGDGLLDLWVGNHFGPAVDLYDRNFFINNGDGSFTDMVAQVAAGTSDVFLADELQGDFHGSAWADFDNDGDQDLIVLQGGEGNTSTLGEENLPPDSGPNRLYVNDNGILRDKATEFGLAYDSAKALTPVWLDYDNDGLLDLFHGSTQRADGLTPTTVFRQTSNGFDDVGTSVLPTGLQAATVREVGLAVLSDDDTPSLVLLRNRDILDIDATPFSDATLSYLNSTNLLSGAFDVAFADFDGDLLMDAYLARGQSDRLLIETPGQGLVDMSQSSGINTVSNTRANSVVAADFDNDMDVDVYVLRRSDGTTNLPNLLYENQGDGTFVAVVNGGGAAGTNQGDGDAVTTADYDLDGFVDLFVTNGAGSVTDGLQQLFRNQGVNGNNWLQIDLEGTLSNRDGIGAQVYVTAGGVTQRRDQTGGVHDKSQNAQRLHYGLAQNTQVDSIEIRWPSGIVQQIENVAVNQLLRIVEEDTDAGAPVAAPDSLSAVESSDLVFSASDLLSNDDLGDIPTTLTAIDTTSANNGTLVDNADGTYTYTPADGFTGTDTFSYTITDADGETSSATVTVTVDSAVNMLPTDGLVLHLDGDAGVSISGGTVSSWADQSGRGNDVVSAGDPTLLSGALNGHDVIEFDGNGDKLERVLALNGLPSGNAERSLFVVAKYDGTGYGGVTYGDNRKNQAFGAVVSPAGTLLAQGWGGANDFDTGVVATGGGWLIQGIVHDGATMNHYRDGSLIDSQAHTYNTDVANGEGLVIGAEIDSNPNVDMDVAAVLIYDRALSDSERQQLETYLQEKYFGDAGNQPMAVADAVTTNKSTDLVITETSLLGNDSLGDVPTTITAIDTSSANGGIITDNGDGTYTYVPAVDFIGVDDFSYTITDADGDMSSATVNVTVTDTNSTDAFLFSSENAATIEGMQVQNEDIVQFDGSTFSLFFDGSDMGLSGARINIDAFDAISSTEILMSFTQEVTLAGLGTVDDSDIVKFNATSLGSSTAGTFEIYLDGSDVGLTSGADDIDGLIRLDDGTLLVSTRGVSQVAGFNTQDEDLLLFNPTSLGETTSGSWSLSFDGSDVALADSNDEDIDAVGIDASGKLFFSTVGDFDVPNLASVREDVFGFSSVSLGENNTSGSFDSTVSLDGSSFGLSRTDIIGIDVTVPTI